MSGSSYSISYKVKNLQASSAFKSYPEISVDAVDKTSLQLLRNQTHIKISKALHVGCITIYQRDVEVETYLAMPDGDKIYRLYDWDEFQSLEESNYKKSYRIYYVEKFDYKNIGLYTCTHIIAHEIVAVDAYINGYEGELEILDNNRDQFVEGDSIDLKCRMSEYGVSYLDSGDRKTVNNLTMDWFDAKTMTSLDADETRPGPTDVLYDTYFQISYKLNKLEVTNGTVLVCIVQHDNRTVFSEFYYNLIVKKKVPLHFVDSNLANRTEIYHKEHSLTCHVVGLPSPNLKVWSEDGVMIGQKKPEHLELYGVNPANGNKLTIKHLPESKIANYSCKVSNRLGESIEAYQILTSEDRAKIRFLSTTNLDNSTNSVRNWTAINSILKCYADSDPKPTIVWYKNGLELDDYNKKNDDAGIEVFVNNTEQHKILVKSLPALGHVMNYSFKASNNYEYIAAYRIIRYEGNALQFLKKDTSLFKENLVIVVLSLTVFLLIIGVAYYFILFERRRQKLERRYLREAGLLSYGSSSSKERSPQKIDNPLHYQIDNTYYTKKWEFNRKRLTLGDKLRSGAFCVVMKATAYGICSGEEETTVAVKMVHSYADASEIRALANELKVMIYIGKHLNVLNLLGACTAIISKRELFVIVEYCQHGNLHDYLLNNRENFIGEVKVTSNRSSLPSTTLCTRDLVSWSWQVARGMEYISQKKIIHGDLAARKILLAESNIVKICDFGLAKMLYKNYDYLKTSRGLLPIRWMSIESIRDRVFSTQSDVWSYGVLLWELFSLAEVPYYNVHNTEKLLSKLLSGYRLKKPEHAPNDVYEVIRDCWIENPDSRPTFTILVEQISKLIETSVQCIYTELSASQENIDTIKDEIS